MNDALMTTSYDLLAFTETWWDDSINIAHVTAGTDFAVFHLNRRGAPYGGVALAVRKNLRPMFKHSWSENDKIEAIAVEFTYDSKLTLIVLVYWPPKNMHRDIVEAQQILQWTEQQPYERKIITGDLNLTGIQWCESEDNVDVLEPNESDARPFERDLTRIFDDMGLVQCNSIPNRNERYLDILLCNFPERIDIVHDIEEQDILKYSLHHRPFVFQIAADAVANETTKTRTKVWTDQKKLKRLLSGIAVPDEIESKEEIEKKIREIYTAISQSTTSVTERIPSWEITHPWLSGNRNYKKLRTELNKAKRVPANKAEVKRLQILMRNIYDRSKKKHFDKLR